MASSGGASAGSRNRSRSPPVKDIELTKSLLEVGDDKTSNAIIAAFKQDASFLDTAKKSTQAILQRDQEDDDKLADGIKMAVAKGVVPSDPGVEPVCSIDVLGMSADAVAAKIIDRLGEAPNKGCVLVLQGLSGTGKGTTVSKLEAALPRAVCWSNGNVFRSLTLLAVSYCEQKGVAFGEDMLTPELLQQLVQCLTFSKVDGKYDIHINGFGHNASVSKVANTVLKEPRVGKNIPTVAKVTQGEVIKFAAAAADTMRADGMNVLMEGRAQTLNYVRTPHRFELTLSEPALIGMRQAALRMRGQALAKLAAAPNPSTQEVMDALRSELSSMVA